MILFHGTSDKFLKKILKEGIRPREEHGHSVYKKIDFESREEFVYLTDRYPVFYANFAQDHAGGRACVIRCEVDEDMLFPDEEFIGTVLARQEHKGAKNLKEITKKMILDVDPWEYQHEWPKSMKYMGTVATLFVKPEQITGHYVFKKNEIDLMFACGLDTDPQAGARYGIPQSAFDAIPGRISWQDSLNMLIDQGGDAVRAAKLKAHEEFMKSFARLKELSDGQCG